MASVYFKRVELTNFMSYEHAELNLNRTGNILVGGMNQNPEDSAKSNGCGKSSLFSAIVWCLTGETSSGSKSVENIYLDGRTEVELEFYVDKDHFKLRRTKNPSNLFFEVNGENKSGKGIRDTSNIVSQYLPRLTSSGHGLLSSVIILGQGLPQKFTNNSPSGRKEVLETLSESDFMIYDLRTKLADRKKTLDKDQRDLEDVELQETTLINSKEFEIKKLNEDLMYMLNNTQLDEAIKDCQEELDKYESIVKEVDTKIKEFTCSKNEKIIEQKELSLKLNEEMSSLNLSDEKVFDDEILSLSSDIRSLDREIKKNESIRDICPTCGQKIQGVTKIDTTEQRKELEEKKKRLDLVNNEVRDIKARNEKIRVECHNRYNDQINKLNSEVASLDREISKFDLALKDNEGKKEFYKNKLASLKSDRETADNERAYKEKRIKELEAEIENSKEKLYTNNEQLEIVHKRQDINSKMQTLIKRDFRGYLLNNVISFIEERAKIYAVDVFGTDKLKFELNGNNIDISYDGKDYSCLSGGEKQKLDVIIQFAIREMLCTFLDFSSNILVLDEITDALDSIGVNKIFNLISSSLQDVEATYIISHHVDELEIPADDEIIIIKGDDKISRIV